MPKIQFSSTSRRDAKFQLEQHLREVKSLLDDWLSWEWDFSVTEAVDTTTVMLVLRPANRQSSLPRISSPAAEYAAEIAAQNYDGQPPEQS
jgi:hypothetical protein